MIKSHTGQSGLLTRLQQANDKKYSEYVTKFIGLLPVCSILILITGYLSTSYFYWLFGIDVFKYFKPVDYISCIIENMATVGIAIIITLLSLSSASCAVCYRSYIVINLENASIIRKIKFYYRSCYKKAISANLIFAVLIMLFSTSLAGGYLAFCAMYHMINILLLGSKFSKVISRPAYITTICIICFFALNISYQNWKYDSIVNQSDYYRSEHRRTVVLKNGINLTPSSDTILIGTSSDFIFLHDLRHNDNLIEPMSSLNHISENNNSKDGLIFFLLKYL